MKKFLLFIFMAIPLCADISVTPTFVPRSQGRDKLRTLVGTFGWGHTDLCDMDCWYGNVSFGAVYTDSFKSDAIARCMFGSDVQCGDCDDNGRSTILVQGSEVADRACNAWLADYMYQDCEFGGSFSIKPEIQNVMLDFDLYLGLDPLASGLYIRIYGPVTWTKWKTDFCTSSEITLTVTSCREGYFTPTGSEVPLASLSEYFEGKAPAAVDGITFTPLRFAKFPACDETKTSVAEVRMEFGWNAVQTQYSHFGLNAQFAIPTGNRRDAEYVFSPVVGNGRHWEFGGGLNAHYICIANEEEDRHFGFYTDVSITHMFKAVENRTFDLCGKPNSRYMLAMKINDPILNNLSGSNLPDSSAPNLVTVTNPDAQFKNEYNPVANLTSIGLFTSATVQVDWVTFLNFSNGGFTFDIGYNLWVRTCESLSNRRTQNVCKVAGNVSLFDENQDNAWALKGDANMFGYATADEGGLVINQAVPLSATQSDATMRRGTNSIAQGNDPELANLGVDNPRFAYAGDTDQQLNFSPDLLATEDFHIKTSLNPEFINFENIEFQPTRGLSHKVFAHIGYTWDREDIAPFFGFGGFAEFGQNSEQQVGSIGEEATIIATLAGECFDCSLSQWGIWVKMGASFG